jgi:transcriptional regulator with XRE-family HTH domain
MDYESGPETIDRVLASDELGRKLRQLRLKKKIALTELGRHTGLSASMLSQLENGKLIPTLPTLARIGMVFDVGMEYFFGSQRKPGMIEVVRKEERMQFPARDGEEAPPFLFEVLAFKATNKPFETYLAEFPKLAEGEEFTHQHAGSELVHVLEGDLRLQYLDEEIRLEAGDTAYFDATELHSYRGVSRKPAKAIIVATQPAR